MSTRLTVLVATTLWLVACFDPEIPNGILCGPNQECPSGQVCVDNGNQGICQRTDFLPEPDADIRALSFRTAVDTPAGANANRMFLAELDGNLTLPDLVVVGGPEGSVGWIRILTNDGDGSFGMMSPILAGDECRAVAVGNIDGQFGTDFAALCDVVEQPFKQELRVALNTEIVNNYEELTVPLDPAEFWQDPHLTDLTGDGLLDVVLRSESTEYFGVLEHQSIGMFVRGPNISSIPEVRDLVIADVTNDSVDDLVFGAPSGVFMMEGSTPLGQFSSPIPLSQSRSDQVIVDNVNADGRPDIISSTDAGGSSSVELMLHNPSVDNAYLSAQRIESVSLNPRLASADFNMDSRGDIVSMTGDIAMQQEEDTFSFATSDSLPADVEDNFVFEQNPVDVLTADFNSDGLQDVAVLLRKDGDNGKVVVYLQQ